jgi:hypothetical protein
MTAQEWIERYAAEVGRMLPARNRADVEQEISSLLHDAVEAEAGGAEAQETQALAVLRQFGPPREMAMRYGASQYLIGPLLYPTYLTVLRWVVGIVLAVSLFGMVLALAEASQRPNLFDIVGGVLGGVIQAAAWVTLIFALLERLNLRELKQMSQTWDPRSLPAPGNVDRVSAGETIFTVVFNVAFIAVLGALLDSQGRIAVKGSDWTSMAIFSAEFMRYLPWLMALLAADAVLAVITLMRGRWTPLLRLAAIAVNLAGVAVAAAMLAGPSLAAHAELALAFDIIVAVILVANVVEGVQQAWRLWRSRWP